MIAYGQKEMDYLAGKDPVMAKLIVHYGYFERGVEQTVFSSLITHIVSQMLSNKVGAVLNGRLHAFVGEYTPENLLRQTPAAIKGIGISQRKAVRGGMVKAHGFKTLSRLRFERYRKKYTPYGSVASLYYYAVNDDDEAWLKDSDDI